MNTVTRRELFRLAWGGMVAVAAPSILSGCGKSAPSAFAQSEQKPTLAIALIVDGTESCAKGRDIFKGEVNTLLSAGYLPKGTAVAIISSCRKPVMCYGGSSVRGKEVKDAIAQAFNPCPCAPDAPSSLGSNPRAAFEMASEWLQKPEFKDVRRQILAWSDLIPDGAPDHPEKFPDPQRLDWAGLKDVSVFLFGLSYEHHEAFRKAWAGQHPAPVFFQPGEHLQPVTLGLRASVL